MEKIYKTLVYCPQAAFMAPYLGAEMGHDKVFICSELPAELPPDVTDAIMISNADIYAIHEGKFIDEHSSIDSSSQFAEYEAEFKSFARKDNLPSVILRCANIVGTGMNGFPMRLARGIDNGLLFHIRGNETYLSVVHAVDVARTAKVMKDKGLLTDEPEVYNVTDGKATSIDELIEALAFRIKNKNVMTIPPVAARLLYGKSYFGLMTTNLTYDNAKVEHATGGMHMQDVCEYLHTHDYNEESL